MAKGLQKLSAKHLDFLLVQPHTAEPVLAIELGDRSHSADKRIERDAFGTRP